MLVLLCVKIFTWWTTTLTSCLKGKMTRKAFPKDEENRSSGTLDLIHSDWWRRNRPNCSTSKWRINWRSTIQWFSDVSSKKSVIKSNDNASLTPNIRRSYAKSSTGYCRISISMIRESILQVQYFNL